jgi:hypothetical protein
VCTGYFGELTFEAREDEGPPNKQTLALAFETEEPEHIIPVYLDFDSDLPPRKTKRK